MKINNWIAIALFVTIIIIIGRFNAKIGMTIAAIILLGTIIVNKNNVMLILNGGSKK